MAQGTFQYHYFINAPAAHIYEHLAQPENYVGLSPLIVAVSDLAQSTDADGHTVVRYRSIERFNFLGFIRYDNKLSVTMTLAQFNRQIISDVDSPFWVKVRFTFDLQPGDGGTWIEETIRAHAPLIVKGFVLREAKRVQLERARILKERMERF